MAIDDCLWKGLAEDKDGHFIGIEDVRNPLHKCKFVCDGLQVYIRSNQPTIRPCYVKLVDEKHYNGGIEE